MGSNKFLQQGVPVCLSDYKREFNEMIYKGSDALQTNCVMLTTELVIVPPQNLIA